MVQPKQSCSGIAVDEDRFGAEFRNIVDTLFCACLGTSGNRKDRLRRDLFRLVEIDGRDLAQAAGSLGLTVPRASDMLGKTRRDMAVLMALGLCLPDEGPRRPERRHSACRCRGVLATPRPRGDHPVGE